MTTAELNAVPIAGNAALLLLALYRSFVGNRFYLSWWAYSFPVAALAIACMLMHSLSGLVFFKVLAWVLLLLLATIIVGLVARTLKAVASSEICVEE